MKETAKLIWGEQTSAEAANDAEAIITIQNADAIPAADGTFSAPYPTITAETESGYISGLTGVSVLFDARLWNYPSGDVVITYEADEVEETTTQAFAASSAYAYINIAPTWPDDAVVKRVSIVCKRAQLGGRLLKIKAVNFGRVYVMPFDYMRDLHVTASADFSGATAPYSTLSTTIDARGLDGILGLRQLLRLETNRRKVGEFYVDSINKTGRDTYVIKAVDALGCLAGEKYPGEEFIGMTPASAAVVTIAGDYTAIYRGGNISPSGLIKEGDKRAALLQIATAAGCYVRTNAPVGDVHAISVEPVDYNSAAAVVSKASTYAGPETENEDIVTAYKLTTHAFTMDDNGDIVIGNTRYKDTRTENEYTLATADGKPTVKTLSGALLVTDATAAANARRLMRERYSRRKIWRGSYLWQDGDEGRVGSVVQVRTADGSIIYGNVIKADLNFSAASIRVDADVLSFETLPAMEIWLGEEADVLTWSSDVPDASRFEIYRDGVLIGTTTGNEWPAETPGDYIVIARGDRGAYSEPSNVVHIAAYREELAPSPAYSVAVPLAALARATLYKVGGKSVKWNQKFQANRSAMMRGVSMQCTGSLVSFSGTSTQAGEIYIQSDIYLTIGHKHFIYVQGSQSIIVQYTVSGFPKYQEAIVSADASGRLYPTIPSTRNTTAGTVFNETAYIIAVDLTEIFGAGNEPTSTTDARVAELKAIAAALPQYDAGSIKHAAVDIVRGDAPLIIPQAVRDLPDYGAGVGDVYNEIDMEPTIYHNMKAVDLGTLTWYSDSGIFRSNALADVVRPETNYIPPNFLSQYYAPVAWGNWSTAPDRSISFALNGTQNTIRIKDARYSTPAEFKAAMNGVVLHYEATAGGEDYAARLYHKRIAHRTIDGTQTLSVWKTYGVSTPFSDMKKFASSERPVGLCDRLENVVDANIVNGRPSVRLGWNSNVVFLYNDKNMTTTAEYAQWFADNPTTVFYELADEQVFDITPYFPAAPVVNVSAGGSVVFENAPRLEVPEKLAFRIPE